MLAPPEIVLLTSELVQHHAVEHLSLELSTSPRARTRSRTASWPWAYLRDVLTLLTSWQTNDVLALAPKHWNETRQRPKTQQLLASLRLLGRNDASHAGEATAAA